LQSQVTALALEIDLLCKKIVGFLQPFSLRVNELLVSLARFQNILTMNNAI